MSQESIIELLSVTRNAVKALERTKFSRSPNSWDGTPRDDALDSNGDHHPSLEQQSSDSGVGKTVTCSVQKVEHAKASGEDDSDDSTTASEVLLRSTVIEVEQNRSHGRFESRGLSKDSHNLNRGQVKTVKIAKHKVREILSPSDDISNGTYKTSHLDVQARNNLLRDSTDNSNQDLNVNNNNNNNNNKKLIDNRDRKQSLVNDKAANGYPGKIIPGILDGDAKENKIPKSSVAKCEIVPSEKTSDNGANCSVYTVERHGKTEKSIATREFPINFDVVDGKGTNIRDNLQCHPSVYVVDKHEKTKAVENGMMLNEEEHESTGDDDESRASLSQPEIITVRERLVNISSQAVLSDSEESSSGSAAGKLSHVGTQQYTFPRAKPTGLGLKQGSLVQEVDIQDKGKRDEVFISKFSLTEKQQQLRDALAKRGSQAKPIKKIVHPKMVDPRSLNDMDGNTNNNMDMGIAGTSSFHNMESVTAAVAASATAAVTQPLLKLQQELEGKIQGLLGEIDRLQQAKNTGTVVTDASSQRLEQLEQQVKDLTERRLQHLEVLQQQQMEMQAHLLSMSRQMSQSYPPVYTFQQQQASSFPAGMKNSSSNRYQDHGRSLIESHLAKGRLLGEHPAQFSAKEKKEHQHKDTASSLLDTPAPRDKAPRPLQYSEGKGNGILQEILATENSPQLNDTFSFPHGQTPQVKLPRPRYDDDHSPVEKARKLVHDLSALEEQTTRSLWDAKKKSRSKVHDNEPAPLEQYLNYKRDANASPYPKHRRSKREGSSSPSKSSSSSRSHTSSNGAPAVDKFGEARNVLQSVMAQRHNLESNLELMLRSRQDVDVYALLEPGASSAEASRIQKMVEKRISALQQEVQREIECEHRVIAATDATVRNRTKKSTVTGRSAVGFGSSAPRVSRLDSRPAKSQSTGTISSAAAGGSKKSSKMKPAAQKSRIPYEDEQAMTQIYGKALYQKGRTTVRDPYLHFQNEAKSRAARIPSPKRVESMLNVKSSKTQTEVDTATNSLAAGIPRKFYFTPSMGYVPLSSSASGPIQGHLIPTAVPLGKPRMDQGLVTAPPTLLHPQTTAAPSIRPIVTAATNVALVGMTAEPEGPQQNAPELSKQVLPAVDIDSISPSSSPRSSIIDVQQPDTSHNAVFHQTFHCQESDDEESEQTLTDTLEEDQQGVGLSLPGYHQPLAAPSAIFNLAPKSAELRHQHQPMQHYEGGKVPWEERCDELAEDLRHRDVLQNRAKYWLEQELMARLLMRMYPVMESAEQAEHNQEECNKSESIPDDESLLVDDAIGRNGLQLFIDAGQPVNNVLVTALMREVIEERVNRMLAMGHMSEATERETAVEGGSRAGGSVNQDEPDYIMQTVEPQRIPTPQPTPRTSPIPGKVSLRITNPPTPPLTPPQSPEPLSKDKPALAVAEAEAPPLAEAEREPASRPDGQKTDAQLLTQDSDSEVSSSFDISTELKALEDKLKQPALAPVASQYDVATPTTTPPRTPSPTPSEQTVKATPPPSPPLLIVEPTQPEAQVEAEVASPRPDPKQLTSDGATDYTQPPPLMVSVSAGPGPLGEEQLETSLKQRSSPSTADLESDSVSSSSSSSLLETNNDIISEGQWLLSRSEGQVAALPIDEDLHRLAASAARKVDVSTASTLRDTEDIEFDDTDVSRSEGEFHHRPVTDINPETDAVLALVLEMQSQLGSFEQRDLPENHVHSLLQVTGHSTGEVRVSQEAMTQAAMDATGKSIGEISLGKVLASNLPVTMVMPTSTDLNQHTVEGSAYQQQARASENSVTGGRRPNTPSRVPYSLATSGPRRHQQQYQPVNSGLPTSVAQGKRPLKSALVRSNDDTRLSRSSNFESERQGVTMDFGAHTGESEQFHTDTLIQTGMYTSRSSSRQGSIKKSVDFDLSGTYEIFQDRLSRRNSEDDHISTMESSEHLSDMGRSLGLSYSFEDSASERDFHSSGRSHLRMSVTIPTTGEGDSDVSEIEITDNAAH